MILDVEEEAVGSVLDFLSCASFDVRTSIRDCLLEDGQNVIVVVSAGHKPAVEQPQFRSNVQRTRAQSVHSHHVAHDQAREDPWWMG